MGEKCKPSYKNLNTIQSYSEQKYATVQWCQQNCENDEWLKRQVDQLRYLSPPAVRANKIITKEIDFSKSYGCTVNGDTVGFKDGGTRTIDLYFNNDDEIKVIDDDSLTTADRRTKVIKSTETDSNGNPIKVKKTFYTLPKGEGTRIKAINKVFGNATQKTGGNTGWYIGFDKSKDYYIRPDWLKDWRDGEIPSVVRAQTFKVPKGKGGDLLQVGLGLKWRGTKYSNTGSPLYVQIWNTYKRWVPVKNWNVENWRMEYQFIKYTDAVKSDKRYEKLTKYSRKKVFDKWLTGKNKGKVKKTKDGKERKKWAYTKETKKNPVEDKDAYVKKHKNVMWLGQNHYNEKKKKYASNRYHPLAQAKHTEFGERFANIHFKTPCHLEEGEHYAIVVYSPLSEWKHCPMWRGWGRNCQRDEKYPDGHAFMSEDNGKTWVMYGKNGEDVDDNKKILHYKQGRYTPQDFMFQCKVRHKPSSKKAGTYKDGVHYIYFEPIYDNPIKHVQIDAYGDGLEYATNTNVFVRFEVNTTGKEGDWEEVQYGTNGIDIGDHEKGIYPSVILLRAKLWHTDGINKTPTLQSIHITLTTDDAKEMYARSYLYSPKTAPMLGANVWGRLYAPFDYDATVDCNAEIIMGGKSTSEHFKIINVKQIQEKLDALEIEDYTIAENSSTETIIAYVESHTGLLDVLKKHNVYIKPTELNNQLHLLSFSPSYKAGDMIVSRLPASATTVSDGEEVDGENPYDGFKVGGIKITNPVAYPVLRVENQGEAQEDSMNVVDVYNNLLDYNFDYENNELVVTEDKVQDLMTGDLEVVFNQLFISRLTRQDVGRRIDIETGEYEEGLILDYFKETITVTSDHIKNRRIKLRAKPTDPIREVSLYKFNRDDSEEHISLYENRDYKLDVPNYELEFNVSSIDGVSTILSEGDILEIVYTPYLPTSSLAVGYYATREKTNMQCRINDMYWEYKV